MTDVQRPTSACGPLSILMLTDFLYEDAPGGSRRVVKEVAEGLAAREHRVTIVVPRWDGDDAERDERGGVAIYRYGHGDRGLRALPALVSDGRRVLAELRREQGHPFDILHAHFAYSHLPALFSRRLDLAWATARSFYGPWALEGLAERGPRRQGDVKDALGQWAEFRGRSLVEARSLAHADATIALSDYSVRQLMGTYNMQRSAVTFVPGGVDTHRFTPPGASKDEARCRLGLPIAGPLVLTVRRLAARMGLDNLIAAMPHVVRSLPVHPHLVIVGQGQHRARLEAQVAALGLENDVSFAGFVPDDELPLYYQSADLFVLPTRSLEGFGLITLEAFASGLPVVGTPVGATPELLAQVDRRLILDGSGPEAIATGIVRYFRELQGVLAPEALRKLVSSTYTWATMVSRTESVYEQACHNAGHRAR